MNKFVLLPHKQYDSFKKFIDEKSKEIKPDITEERASDFKSVSATSNSSLKMI